MEQKKPKNSKNPEKKTSQNTPPKEELLDTLLRTQANFENYRKQMDTRMVEIREMAAKEIILKILPVLDNFELAFKNTCQETNQEFLKGIELIYSQLNEILTEQGVKVIETKNQQFDPYFHEALMKVESEQAENTIIEEFQKGYTLHDKVIRHAKVKISSGKKKEDEIKAEENNCKNDCEKDKCKECAAEDCTCEKVE